MIVIRLQNGLEWYKANWVFRDLVSTVRERFPDDEDVRRELAQAEAFGLLTLDSLESPTMLRVFNAIKAVAQEAAAGTPTALGASAKRDEDRWGMYLEAVSELLSMMTRGERSG